MPSVFPIVLNSKNAVVGNNSQYVYKFPRGSINLKKASVALSQVNMYYSWANINAAAFNNASFQIIFPDATPGTFFSTIDVTVPNGNYTVEALNSYLQSVFIAGNRYLINNSTGQFRYFYEILSNPQTYSIQLISHTIPTSLPTGFTEPPGGFSYPGGTGTNPSMTILDNGFGDLIGFEQGVYFDAISSKVPQMSPVSSVLVTCSLINNKFTNPNNIIYSFTAGGATYGSKMSIQAQNLVFNNIDDGVYSEVCVNFIDNEFRPLNIIDTNLIIYLIVQIED